MVKSNDLPARIEGSWGGSCTMAPCLSSLQSAASSKGCDLPSVDNDLFSEVLDVNPGEVLSKCSSCSRRSFSVAKLITAASKAARNLLKTILTWPVFWPVEAKRHAKSAEIGIGSNVDPPTRIPQDAAKLFRPIWCLRRRYTCGTFHQICVRLC